MKRFYLVVNPEKDPGYRLAEKIRKKLTEAGASCEYHRGTHPDGRYYHDDPSWVPEGTEAVLVLGGDGTMIQAARDLVGLGLPMLGVKLGTMGYLAGVDRQGLPRALDRMLSDDFEIEERMMLEGRVRIGGQLSTDIAMNDIVMVGNGQSRMIHYQVSVNGAVLHRYAADGLILSTPTGSTAYNLSAGGPIVEPTASLMLLTPISPHALNNRSIVLSPEDEVLVQLCGRPDERARISFDGNPGGIITAGDMILISRAGQKTKLIKLNQTSFLETLRDNMSV